MLYRNEFWLPSGDTRRSFPFLRFFCLSGSTSYQGRTGIIGVKLVVVRLKKFESRQKILATKITVTVMIILICRVTIFKMISKPSMNKHLVKTPKFPSNQQKKYPKPRTITPCKQKRRWQWQRLTQISCDSGFMKLNTPGVCLIGFLIIIDIPSDMNGFEKSITLSLSAVIVIAAMAISASCNYKVWQNGNE